MNFYANSQYNAEDFECSQVIEDISQNNLHSLNNQKCHMLSNDFEISTNQIEALSQTDDLLPSMNAQFIEISDRPKYKCKNCTREYVQKASLTKHSKTCDKIFENGPPTEKISGLKDEYITNNTVRAKLIWGEISSWKPANLSGLLQIILNIYIYDTSSQIFKTILTRYLKQFKRNMFAKLWIKRRENFSH